MAPPVFGLPAVALGVWGLLELAILLIQSARLRERALRGSNQTTQKGALDGG